MGAVLTEAVDGLAVEEEHWIVNSTNYFLMGQLGLTWHLQ